MARRQTRRDYDTPGSFGRVLEAGIAAADADSEDDADFHAREMRLRSAVNDHAPRALGAKGGRASASMLTAEQRADKARRAAQARWRKRATSGA